MKKNPIQPELFDQPYQLAEIQVSYKPKVKAADRPQVTCSKDAYNIFISAWDENRIELCEDFKVLMLNRANRALGIYHMAAGGMAGVVADPKLAFVAALKCGASSMILAHNHPSGSLKPSRQDDELTRKFREAGRLLDIDVPDHLIVTPQAFYSYADESPSCR